MNLLRLTYYQIKNKTNRNNVNLWPVAEPTLILEVIEILSRNKYEIYLINFFNKNSRRREICFIQLGHKYRNASTDSHPHGNHSSP